jgi:hypothetical protein
MKKLLMSLVLFFSVSLMSCTDSNGVSGSVFTSTYQFTTTVVTTCSPSLPGYPQTVTSTTTQSGLTETEANNVCVKMTSTTTSVASGYTMTVKMTTTKKKI